MKNNMIIEVKDLRKTYMSGSKPLDVLKGINFTVNEGEIISIIGESGSGKSTLLNLIGGIDSVTTGKIKVYDEEISDIPEIKLADYRNKIVSFIFQFHYLLTDFTAIENVAMPFLARNFNRNEAFDRAKTLLEEVKMDDRADHKPNQLSGGEQQRVAIARALINHPKIVLADEPTGNLDEKNTNLVRDILWKLREKYDITLLLVTHNISFAGKADRMLKLNYGVVEHITNNN